MLAVCRTESIQPLKVDRTQNVVFGCQLAKLGKVAKFADSDGKPLELLVTPSLIDGLLALWRAEERAPAHWTHDWIYGVGDPLSSTVATLRNFAKDAEGNLIADAFLWPTDKREAILYAAESDPEGMMFSMVFDYSGGRDDAKATSVTSADLVECGAATTALCKAIFSAITKPNAIMADPTPPDPTPPAAPPAAFSPEQEQRIGELIADALKKAGIVVDQATDPEPSPAMMKAATKAFAGQREAILKEAEARVVKQIGANPGLRDFGGAGSTGENPLQIAIKAQLAAGATSRAVAIMRALKDKPELEQYRTAV